MNSSISTLMVFEMSSIYFEDIYTQKDKVSPIPEVAGELVAIIRNQGGKKPRSKPAKIGTGLDPKIIPCKSTTRI